MKKVSSLLFPLAWLALLAPIQAGASNQVELRVIGTIRPPACTPTLSNNGTVDFGTIHFSSMVAGQPMALEPKSTTLNISCAGPTKIGLNIKDNRADSVMANLSSQPVALAFGLGKIDNASIGIYHLRFISDGDRQLIHSTDDGKSWQRGDYLASSYLHAWSNSADLTQASQVQHLSGTVEVAPHLAPPETLPAGREIRLDGSATFEVTYL